MTDDIYPSPMSGSFLVIPLFCNKYSPTIRFVASDTTSLYDYFQQTFNLSRNDVERLINQDEEELTPVTFDDLPDTACVIYDFFYHLPKSEITRVYPDLDPFCLHNQIHFIIAHTPDGQVTSSLMDEIASHNV